MSAVVTITWAGLAITAEVRVVADSTLVAGAHNVLALVLAERAITVDADMAMACRVGSWDGIVKCREAVVGMNVSSILDALGAVVPIRA
jgi:hypothetical protein